MEKEKSILKYNIKIALTRMKVCYSVSFMIILALIRGVSHPEEIGIAMDTNVALLAIIFCSDVYYQEIYENRWENINLLPKKNRFSTIFQRLLIQFIYLISLCAINYWVFYIRFISYRGEVNLIHIYITAIFACSASILFFGVLSFTFVNLLRNLWAGIGATFLVWITLNSTFGKRIPSFINVFAYGINHSFEIQTDWIIGKLTAIIASILLIYINKELLVWNRKG